MKKRLIVLLMFLLSCLGIYSNEINNQSNSNSFSSKNFLKKLTSLAPENPEKTEKFANYLKNEMERKKEVSYLIKIDKEQFLCLLIIVKIDNSYIWDILYRSS